MQEDISDLQERVDIIESQLTALQTAYNDGKIIKDVKPYQDTEHTGWTIIFSDNESIFLYNGTDGKDGENGKDGQDGADGKDGENGKDGADGKDGQDGADGKDGITPMVSINEEGYWEVSYDNGTTWTLLKDDSGNPIMSKGEKGNEGLSVRIIVDENGDYVIESYYKSDVDKVISSIVTPYSSNPSNQIASIIKNPYDGTIKLVMKDGTEFLFNLDVNYPTSIVVLAESVVLPKKGTSVFQFRVNPSNAVVDLNLTNDNPMFELDMAISNMTRSYVTESDNYTLDKIEHATDAEGNIKEGQYLAYVTDLGLSDDFCEGATMVLNTKDGNGNQIQVSSDLFKIMTPDKPQFALFSINGIYASDLHEEFINIRLPYGTNISSLTTDFIASEGTVTVDGKEVQTHSVMDFSSPKEFTITAENGRMEKYIVSISFSRIPVVYINTKDSAPIVSKEDWLKETEIYVTNAGEESRLYEDAQIRGRGNSTWECPKKPYAIKLDSKETVLGMPKHKRWVLLANYFDKSCLRNSIAFEIARRSSGLDWTPRGYHVDVVLNGVMLGNYYLCEQIKIDENRVNINEGYLLELDKHFDEINKFYSPIRNMPFMVKEPDEEDLTADQFTFIQNHVGEIENALYGEETTTEGYLQYLDLDSFIDYWLVYELTSTGEPTHPKSVYMYLSDDGKMYAGPVWDFDYFTYQPYYNTMLINSRAVWNDRIIHDPNNAATILERWNRAREGYQDIENEIIRQYELIKESAEYNAQIWSPLTREPNKEENMSVEEIVTKMLGFYREHFAYMDAQYKYQ